MLPHRGETTKHHMICPHSSTLTLQTSVGHVLSFVVVFGPNERSGLFTCWKSIHFEI